MNHDDLPTPASQRSTPVVSPAVTITPDRHFSMDLARWVVVVAALVGGGFTAAWQVRGLVYQVERLESRLQDLATRADVAEMRRGLEQGWSVKFKTGLVRCPKVAAKGDSHINCTVLFE